MNRAYKGTVISDVRNATIAIGAFVEDYGSVPESVSCPSVGYGPARCDLTDGTNIAKNALSVSKGVRVEVEKVNNCNGSESFKIHGTHLRLNSWGYCFSACEGYRGNTDGSGCP